MWMGALASMALLAGFPSWAWESPEEALVSELEAEHHEPIGVATVRAGPGSPWVLPCFEPAGESGFRAAGEVALAETVGLDGWTYEDEALRRFPVLARQGRFLLLVIDVRTGERAWLREEPEPGPRPSVLFEPEDAVALHAARD